MIPSHMVALFLVFTVAGEGRFRGRTCRHLGEVPELCRELCLHLFGLVIAVSPLWQLPRSPTRFPSQTSSALTRFDPLSVQLSTSPGALVYFFEDR